MSYGVSQVKPLREIRPASWCDINHLILNVHYARRRPSISHAFSLYVDGVLEGCVCYGTPSSAPLRKGIAGVEWQGMVLELNRLVLLNNRKNDASYLVSHSLRLIPSPRIVVSFADTSQDHSGIVYQAANFFYCGLSAKRTDWKVKGLEHLHGQTIADQFRGHKNRSAMMREKYGDDFYLAPRPRKHRYIYLVGSKKQRKQMFNDLRYTIEPYPKNPECQCQH